LSIFYYRQEWALAHAAVLSGDGTYRMNYANTEGIFRIIQKNDGLKPILLAKPRPTIVVADSNRQQIGLSLIEMP
jgi:hypothetical protein